MSNKPSVLLLTAALLFASSPAFAQEDPRRWERELTERIQHDAAAGMIDPNQTNLLTTEVGQIEQEHQSFLDQQGGNLTDAQRNLIKSQIDRVEHTRVSEQFRHGMYDHSDPRVWERNLIGQIQKDAAAGLLDQLQSGSLTTEVGQVQAEHQGYLDQQGGNLTDAQKATIKEQLARVNATRENRVHSNSFQHHPANAHVQTAPQSTPTAHTNRENAPTQTAPANAPTTHTNRENTPTQTAPVNAPTTHTSPVNAPTHTTPANAPAHTNQVNAPTQTAPANAQTQTTPANASANEQSKGHKHQHTPTP